MLLFVAVAEGAALLLLFGALVVQRIALDEARKSIDWAQAELGRADRVMSKLMNTVREHEDDAR